MSDSLEGKVVIGAAVIDDVLGLLVLVAVSGLAVLSVSGGPLPWGELGQTMGLAFLFIAIALTVGRWFSPKFFGWASRFRSEETLLPFALIFAFALAFIGSLAGLAAIVGAYTAGLILEPPHVGALEGRERRSVEELVNPLVMTFAPMFFVYTGATVDASTLLQPFTLLLAGVLTVVSILAKYVAGYVAGQGLKPSVVGWGMVPRGEVGIIFVSVGSAIEVGGEPMLTPEVRAGVLGAILLTTILGPIGLARALDKSKPASKNRP